jgi:hypothetical protein
VTAARREETGWRGARPYGPASRMGRLAGAAGDEVLVRTFWTRVPVDGDRCLVYGPRLGRVYLLASRQALDPLLQGLLGLARSSLVQDLVDPAIRLADSAESLEFAARALPPTQLRLLYVMLHRSRHVLPFRTVATLLHRSARKRVMGTNAMGGPDRVSQIGRLVHAIERRESLADCYPRALVTAYLCLSSGLPCDLAIGTLAPTRMVHAWCSTRGELPYEAFPEHYMYRPLFVMRLSP